MTDKKDHITVSDSTIEKEIRSLLQSDSATKADMAVALKKLRAEIGARTVAERKLLEAQQQLEQRVEKRTAELRASETRFRSIIELSPMGIHIWKLNSDGRMIFTDYNPAADRILHVDNSQFLGSDILDAFPALAGTEVPRKFKQICEKGIAWQAEQINYEDDKIKGVFEVHAFQISPGNMATFFLDITERHKMQTEVQRSEERMNLALSAADIAIWDWSIATGETYFSPRYFTMLGYGADELPNTYETWLSLLHDDDRANAVEKVKQFLEHRKCWDIEFRLRTKNGDYRWIRGKGDVVEADANGTVMRAAGTHLDITREKQAEEILRKKENTLNSILVAAPVGIGLVRNRVFSWVSKRIVEMTGYAVDELIGRNARILYPTEEEYLRVGKIKYGQFGSSNVGEVDTVWKKKSGELINIHLRSSPIDSHDLSLGVTFSALDITEKVKHQEEARLWEQQAQQAKNLESLGVLAGGIAHDFNNILMAILGNLSIASQSLPFERKESSFITEAEKACLRAKDLTRQLLTFSKGGEPIKETSSMAGVITDSAGFILRGSAVAIEYNIPEDLRLVDIDKGQISQVIQNLILNAKNAMPDGGKITVSCENVDDIHGEKVPLPESGKYIKITITDTGVGIPATILGKIFEPYYTTKQEGCGLGLAIAFSIIARHHGHINVLSEIGAGTSFFIYLPVADQTDSPNNSASKSCVHTKKLRILVMDDDEMVRNVSKAMLTRLGHDVILAVDGENALELFKKDEDPIDIMIMDLTIPGGMGGRKAVREILAIAPQARVIVSSGYSNDPVMANFKDYGFCAAMVKPYQLDDFSRVIKSVLDS